MKIAVIWTWYVWLTHWTCLAELGNNVICVDIDENKVNNLKKWIIPIFEPKLSDLVLRNFKEKRIDFTTDIVSAIENSEVIFIAVWTPAWIDWHADMQYVKSVANSLWEYINEYKIIVTKSTVPVWTWDMIEEIIKLWLKKRWVEINFDIVSNPEFLKEWTAVDDFFFWDRIVIWCDNTDKKALKRLEELYSPLKDTKILQTNLHTAEIIKYWANAFLWVQISFINMLSQLCEKVWADILSVSEWLKLDSRIGKKAFLNAWPWFWGSCFPKDIIELVQTFKDNWLSNWILEATLEINDKQRQSVFDKINKVLPDLNWKTIWVLWLAFKPNTDDIRYSPSIYIVEKLLESNVKVKAFDPEAVNNFKRYFPDINYCDWFYDTIKDCDLIIIVTDWNEFKQPDWEKVSKLLKQKNIIDTRNIYNKDLLLSKWFNYIWTWR